MSAIAIAPLEQDFTDWGGLLALIRRAFTVTQSIVDPPSSALSLTPATLRAKAQSEIVLVARDGSRIVGCLFAVARDDLFRLGKLAVEPESQRRGIARQLIAAAEARARAEAKHALELQTRVELADNLAVFTHLGFRETGRAAHPGFARPTSVTLRKVVE